MDYEWDEAKRQANIAKHDLDFAFAPLVFDDPDRTEFLDDRLDYGEERRLVFGMIDGRVYCVCYAIRGAHRRIISFRPTHQKEKRLYYDNYKND